MYDDEFEDEYSGSGAKTKTPPPRNEQFEQAEPTDSFEIAAPPVAPPPRSPSRPRPAPAAKPPVPADEDDDGFFVKHGAKIVVAGIVLAIGAAAFFLKPGKGSSTPKPAEHMVSIRLPAPPPPPPPPPKAPTPPPKEEKMETQQPVAQEEKHEEAPKPKAEAPAQTLGTGLKGDGPGMAGLGAAGNGGGFGGAKSGGGGSKWGWYAGQVQSRVADALRRNKITKDASLKIQVRIWPDSTGRVLRAKIDGTTGDRNVDAALQNEVLTGLQLEPPPQGMAMPIVMRLTARRP